MRYNTGHSLDVDSYFVVLLHGSKTRTLYGMLSPINYDVLTAR